METEMEKHARLVALSILEKLPPEMILLILSKLDLESLCATAPVCKSICSSVSQTVSSLSSLDLSEFSPHSEIVESLLGNNMTIQSLTLDCSELDDSSIYLFAKESLEELVLLKCFNFSFNIFTAIGEKCPKLRKLMMEVSFHVVEHPQKCMEAIDHMINDCKLLESLHMKFPNMDPNLSCFNNHKVILPKLIKSFLLQSITCERALLLIPICSGLQSLSLVLNIIADELLVSVSRNLPNLTELCLEDKPWGDDPLNNELSNHGILALCLCKNLKRLSLTRGTENFGPPFKRVNDVGILYLAKGLNQLEFIRLAGFSRVTDAGYRSILHSCKKLKRFEISRASSLSDLTFHDLVNAPRSLVDVRLTACNLLTSEAAASLSSCENLEVMNLCGCRSIADSGLKYISKLCKLRTLDLTGADITDDGLSALKLCSSPITTLCLRGCKRVTERGLCMLFNGESSLSRTLTTLDVGYAPCMTDQVVATISEHCTELTSLSVRRCLYLSDEAVKALKVKKVGIRRLDLYSCSTLSDELFEHLSAPYFKGLRWLGVGETKLCSEDEDEDGVANLLFAERDGLSVCFSGCDMHCDVGLLGHRKFV